MKNFDTRINPFLSAGILGFTTPVAVYFIGFLTMLLSVVATSVLLPFVWNNLDKLMNVMEIGCLVLQVLLVIIFTLISSVFSNLKIYHLLISAAVSGVLFFIVERFIPNIRWINHPWQEAIFPKFFTNQYKSAFDELQLYLPTTLILTGTFFAVSLITWGIYRAASHNKQHKQEL